MKKDLHEIQIRIYQLCLEHKIEFELEWIPRTDIQKADFFSRFIDIDDCQITRECFDTLERLWGYHTIDCFANYYNYYQNFKIYFLALESGVYRRGLFRAKFIRGKLFSGTTYKSYYESIVLSTNTKSASNSYRSILDFVLFLAGYN